MRQRHPGMVLDDYYKMFPGDMPLIDKRNKHRKCKLPNECTLSERINYARKLRKSYDIYSDIKTNNIYLRKAIYDAFDGKCFYTGQQLEFEEMHVDHLVPKSKGGQDCIANYVLTSSSYNLWKNGKVFDNIEELKQKNITTFSNVVLNNLNKFRQSKESMFKYYRVYASPENELQKEFLDELSKIISTKGKSLSSSRLEWLAMLYESWKSNNSLR